MKVISILFGALLAVASVEAAATPEAEPDATTTHHFCYRPGQPCSKLKRAAEAVSEAMAAPEASADAYHHFCYRPGQPCSKAKRDALALAEAVADAYAAAMPAPGLKSQYSNH